MPLDWLPDWLEYAYLDNCTKLTALSYHSDQTSTRTCLTALAPYFDQVSDWAIGVCSTLLTTLTLRHSVFIFKNFMQVLKQCVKSARNPVLQVVNRLQEKTAFHRSSMIEVSMNGSTFMAVVPFSCRSHSLQLSPGFHLRPDHQCRLFQTFA